MTRNRKFQKKAKKFKKLKNTIIYFFSRQYRFEKDENGRKQKLSFKKLNNAIMASFEAKNRLEKEEKEIK